MQSIDFKGMDYMEVYKLLISTVVPRPIAFVTSISPTGVVNAAPFSAYMPLTVDPPSVAFLVGGKGGLLKDTHRNIAASREFVVNAVTMDMADEVQESSEEFPWDQSEVEVTGLEAIPSHIVKPPRIARSPIHFECKVMRIEEFGNVPDYLICGRIVLAHFGDGMLKGGHVDPAMWEALGRVGAGAYCAVKGIFRANSSQDRRITER